VDTHSTLLTPDLPEEPELIIAGQDVVLDILANFLQQERVSTARTYLSSFEGLLSLYQDNIQVTACHLYDGENYNTEYVRRLMPGVPAVLINLSYRTQGFYIQSGNPKGIRGWEDLGRKDLRILNRRPGSSARILLDVQLNKLGIDPKTKTLLFSDSLDFEKSDRLYQVYKDKTRVAFGIGTYLSNDTCVPPLNIVMKPTYCNSWPVAKVSDVTGKGMCKDEDYVNYLTRCIQWRMEHEK
jgi:hypothetical protein